MKNKRMIIGLCVVAVVVAGMAFKFQKSPSEQKQPSAQRQTIPDYEVYRQLFHHHVAMKKKADELEKLGNDGKFLRGFYKREARLSDEQAKVFDEIASSCEDEVAKQDAKARAIIDAALAANGNGKLAKDTTPPEPPAELNDLWEERNAIILRAKDRLQAAFGAQEFSRLEDFVKKNVEARMTSEPANRQRPTSPMGPRHQLRLPGTRPSPQGR